MLVKSARSSLSAKNWPSHSRASTHVAVGSCQPKMHEALACRMIVCDEDTAGECVAVSMLTLRCRTLCCRYDVAKLRYSEPEGAAAKANPHAEQEAWEMEQQKKTHITKVCFETGIRGHRQLSPSAW